MRELLDCPELQRLRHVRQLGFTDLVYPNATHTRFAHSLGAFQGAQLTMRQLQAGGARIADEWFVATALACLLHDVGHGPFSHAYEAVGGSRHEHRTLQIVGQGPRLPRALEAIGPGTHGRVLQLLRGQVEDAEHAFLPDLVSSALDCDRMDYLRRDALFTGASYGSFDRDWIIRELTPTDDRSALVLIDKGRSAAEQYLIGRYHMFQQVYLHKTSRGFETAFRQLCLKVRSLAAAGGSQRPGGAGAGWSSGSTREAASASSRDPAGIFAANLSLEDFLGLTDVEFLYELRRLLRHKDVTVRVLAGCLVERIPPHCATSTTDGSELDQLVRDRRAAAERSGLDPQFAVWRDEAADIPYRPYSPEEGRKGLRLRRRDGGLVDVTELSPTLAALAAKVVLHRVYWIAEG